MNPYTPAELRVIAHLERHGARGETSARFITQVASATKGGTVGYQDVRDAVESLSDHEIVGVSDHHFGTGVRTHRRVWLL